MNGPSPLLQQMLRSASTVGPSSQAATAAPEAATQTNVLVHPSPMQSGADGSNGQANPSVAEGIETREV
jgi:hypothetical protein